jgi:hypothetical protein
MFCRERERLLENYAAALAKDAELAPAIAKLKGKGCWNQAWWDAIEESRERRQQSLAALNQHQATHGC